MKATKCDVCKKYVNGSTGKIEITTRMATFPDSSDVCNACMIEIKQLISGIGNRPEVKKT